MPKFDFVHIGLGKCMSSRLQGHWELDPGYNALSAKGIASAVDQIIAQSGSPSNVDANVSGINLNFPELGRRTTNILTSEDLTFSYLHNAELGEAIPVKDEAASKLLAGLTDKVLMLVRDPVEWIRSCYSQQVKEGGGVAFADYLHRFRSVILNNLNLERRIDVWSRSGAEVVILPLELARKSDAEFWTAYENRLGVPRPSNWNRKLDIVGENSTDYASVEPHRRLNEVLFTLENVLAGTNLDQKTEMIKFMNATRKLCIRRALSYADEEALNEVCNLLNMTKVKNGCLEVVADCYLLDTIENTFINPLREDTHFQKYVCLDDYSNSLSKVAS